MIPDLGVAIVADGMGGHRGGDVASQIAANTVSEALKQDLRVTALTEDNFSARLGMVMYKSLIQAHEDIRAEGGRQPTSKGWERP